MQETCEKAGFNSSLKHVEPEDLPAELRGRWLLIQPIWWFGVS
jgi:hypothetical protein